MTSFADGLKATFDGLVADGITFPWFDNEVEDLARGPYCTIPRGAHGIDVEVTDIGGGSQSSTETITVRFTYGITDKTKDWTAFKTALITAVLAAVRGVEKSTTGSLFTRVIAVGPFTRREINADGRKGTALALDADFTIQGFRHESYA